MKARVRQPQYGCLIVVALESVGGDVADGAREIRVQAMENAQLAGGAVEAAFLEAIHYRPCERNPNRVLCE